MLLRRRLVLLRRCLMLLRGRLRRACRCAAVQPEFWFEERLLCYGLTPGVTLLVLRLAEQDVPRCAAGGALACSGFAAGFAAGFFSAALFSFARVAAALRSFSLFALHARSRIFLTCFVQRQLRFQRLCFRCLRRSRSIRFSLVLRRLALCCSVLGSLFSVALDSAALFASALFSVALLSAARFSAALFSAALFSVAFDSAALFASALFSVALLSARSQQPFVALDSAALFASALFSVALVSAGAPCAATTPLPVNSPGFDVAAIAGRP